MKQRIEKLYLPILVFILVSAGFAHFFAPQEFVPSIPTILPFPLEIVYLTGIIEVLAAIGLLLPKWRKLTAYMLIVYFIAILPAHFQMIISGTEIFGFGGKTFFIVRVFFQLIPILLAWKVRHSAQKSVVPALDWMDNELLKRWELPDAWHSKWLWIAAWHNLAFGYWVVIYPNQAFELFGMEMPEYPFVWQSVGMIVGVYGIGYGIAAFDEMRHWVIVLVGWLGKIFGPIGFVYTFFTGDIALVFGTILIFNDLIWYPSFWSIMIKKFKLLRAEMQLG